jgi:hypothetical protein
MKTSSNSDAIYVKLNERIQAVKSELEQLENTPDFPKNAKALEELESLLGKKTRELGDLLATKSLQRAIDSLEVESLALASTFKKN